MISNNIPKTKIVRRRIESRWYCVYMEMVEWERKR